MLYHMRMWLLVSFTLSLLSASACRLNAVALQSSDLVQFAQLIDTSDFPERWHCGNWSTFHGWTHIIADLVIWLAYTSIPIALLVIIRKKKDVLPYPILWVMFSLFIISCGLTHLMEAFIFWWPAYRLLGLLKVITAVVSALTVLILLPKLNRILSLKPVEYVDQEVADAKVRMELEKQKEIEEHDALVVNVIEDNFAGYWDFNLVNGEAVISHGFKAMFGYKDSEIEDSKDAWRSIIFEEDSAAVDQALQSHIQSSEEGAISLASRYRHKDGRTIHVISRGRAIDRDASGKATRLMLCHIDVTQLMVTEQALAARNTLLEMMASGINAGIWDWDMTTGEIWYSPKLYELLGHKENAFKPSAEYFEEEVLHPKHKDSMHAALKRHIQTNEPYRIDLLLMKQNGEYCWFDSSGVAKFDEAGKPLRMVGSIIDIHQRKLLEAKDKKSIETLSRQNERLLSFAHITSHNLRSNSGNMVALLRMYQAETDEEIRRELITHSQSCAEKLHDAVEKLTEVVEIQSSANQAKQIVNFNDVFQEVFAEIREIYPNEDFSLHLNFDNLPSIEYVHEYLRSIFLNLLSNSIRYQASERKLAVTVKSYRENDRECLLFEDNGIGIDLEKNGEKLFGLYKVFGGREDAKGTGLFLIKNQIESLNGKISAESQLGSGTTFKIEF